MQYSISNLNAFVLLISIGYSLYPFKSKASLLDKDNSPIQLVSQLKGYYYINPTLALSLSITLFSFVGIPPLIGFFAKQMVLSAALESNFIFLTLIAILTSVISAVYYLSVIKQIFFDEHDYKLNKNLENTILHGTITPILNNKNKNKTNLIYFKVENLSLTSCLTITVSILTLILLLFILTPQIGLNLTKSLALIMFNP